MPRRTAPSKADSALLPPWTPLPDSAIQVPAPAAEWAQAPAALRAAGDASFATLVTSVSMVLRVLGIWVFGVVLGGGVVAVWTVMVAEWTLRGIVFGWRFRSGEWERKRWVDAAG